MTPNDLPVPVRHIIITRTYPYGESGWKDPRPFEYVTMCGKFRWTRQLPRPTSQAPARTCELCAQRGDEHSAYVTIGHTAAEVARITTTPTDQN